MLKFTVAPVQIGFCEAVTETVGVTIGLTVMRTLLLLTELGEGQGALLVSTHQTESLGFKVRVP